jgi:hypothetical protein
MRRDVSVLLAALVGVLAACGGNDSAGPDLGACQAAVNLFPTPVSDLTSPFSDVDDDYVYVAFASGFTFSFFGTSYGGVYLNSNGGMTFGGGDANYDVAASEVSQPGIAVFWGDLDAGEYGGASRANQMKYTACAQGFFVTYNQLQDNDEETWNNTATVTLAANGKITVNYGNVLSQDILVGVWNGTHANDKYLPFTTNVMSYSTNGTGSILFDDWGPGPTQSGQLNNVTVTYNP